jgi:hypothetical protein
LLSAISQRPSAIVRRPWGWQLFDG